MQHDIRTQRSAAPIRSACLGFPRFGQARELKRAVERFLAGKSSSDALAQVGRELREQQWARMARAGLDVLPSNDFSLHDHVLDAAWLVGALPAWSREIGDPIQRYFAIAQHPEAEIRPWFGTQYWHWVPDFTGQTLSLEPSKILAEYAEAKALGFETRPVILGPITLGLLSKNAEHALETLLPIYAALFEQLAQAGVAWIQLDEPGLTLDLGPGPEAAARGALERLADGHRPKVMLAPYFGGLGDKRDWVVRAGFEGLHLDLARAPEELAATLPLLGERSTLSLGLVDGQNVWRSDLDRAHETLRAAVAVLGPRVEVASSCSLLHVPLDVCAEASLDPNAAPLLAFAVQKIEELSALAKSADLARPSGLSFEASRRTRERPRPPGPAAANAPALERRAEPLEVRAAKQRASAALAEEGPAGDASTPAIRGLWESGRITDEEYDLSARRELLDLLGGEDDELRGGPKPGADPHAGARLPGVAFTEDGWIQVYGSRLLKPPIIYGPVFRPAPSRTGFLPLPAPHARRAHSTGPFTLLERAFVRNDRPEHETGLALALALRQALSDRECRGVLRFRIDEPALYEPRTLSVRDRAARVALAAQLFRLATAGVSDETQIQLVLPIHALERSLDWLRSVELDVLSIDTGRAPSDAWSSDPAIAPLLSALATLPSLPPVQLRRHPSRAPGDGWGDLFETLVEMGRRHRRSESPER